MDLDGKVVVSAAAATAKNINSAPAPADSANVSILLGNRRHAPKRASETDSPFLDLMQHTCRVDRRIFIRTRKAREWKGRACGMFIGGSL